MDDLDFLDIPTEVLLMVLLNYEEMVVTELDINKTEFYESILDELFERCPAAPLEDRPWYMSDFKFNLIAYNLL